jgi:glycosyltransferase involved in cell wall biosynthesis
MFKIIRVVTANYCIPAHLHNTLLRIPDGFQIYIIGDNVKAYAEVYKNVVFIDIPIRRNFSFFSDIYAFTRLVFHFIKIKPDVVHSLMTKAGLFAALAGKLTGVKIRLHTFTGQVWAYKKGLSRQLLKFVDKFICFFNTDCLTDSPSQSNYLFINGIAKNSKPLRCIMRGSLSGVDLMRFNRERLSIIHEELRIKLDFKNTDFILGYIARKSLDKGCIDMLKIFLKIRQSFANVKLIYIGPDESNGQVSAFFDGNPTLKEDVTNIGFVHNHEHYLGICNLLCLPSYREGFGSIVIDAAALGIPTVGYEIPGLVDSVVNDSTGKLVKCGDMDAFVEVTEYFVRNPNVLQEYSTRSRTNAVNFFDADLMNDSLYEIYKSLGL